MGEVDGDLQDDRTLRHDLLVVGGANRVGRRSTRSGDRLSIKGDGFAGCPAPGGVGSVAVSDGLQAGVVLRIRLVRIATPDVEALLRRERLTFGQALRIDVDRGGFHLTNNDQRRTSHGIAIVHTETPDDQFGGVGIVGAVRVVLGVDALTRAEPEGQRQDKGQKARERSDPFDGVHSDPPKVKRVWLS